MIFAEIDSTYEQLLDNYRENHFTRIPVFEESTDNVIGMPFSVDYGIRGVLLPLCACAFTKKPQQLILFAFGIVVPMIILKKSTTS